MPSSCDGVFSICASDAKGYKEVDIQTMPIKQRNSNEGACGGCRREGWWSQGSKGGINTTQQRDSVQLSALSSSTSTTTTLYYLPPLLCFTRSIFRALSRQPHCYIYLATHVASATKTRLRLSGAVSYGVPTPPPATTTTTICGIHSPSRAVPASRTRPTCLSFTQVTTEVTGSGACGHLHSSTTCGPIPFNTASPTPYRCVLVELLQQTRR